ICNNATVCYKDPTRAKCIEESFEDGKAFLCLCRPDEDEPFAALSSAGTVCPD
ncbi:unnamed protein product, partial [Didymodactylos carnosus]